MTDLYVPDNLHEVDMAATQLLSRLQCQDHPSDTELVVGKCWHYKSREWAIAYYFASMSCRAVFWLEDFDPTLVTKNDRIVVSETHLGRSFFLFFLTYALKGR